MNICTRLIRKFLKFMCMYINTKSWQLIYQFLSSFAKKESHKVLIFVERKLPFYKFIKKKKLSQLGANNF